MAVSTRGLRTPSTRGFVSPSLNLRAPRDRASVRVEQEFEERGVVIPPFVPWEQFVGTFDWRQGEHMTLVGGTGSGKTTLARQLLPRRDFVVVLATKPRDTSLYDPLLRQGYVIRETFDPDWRDTPRVIFRPRLSEPTKAGLEEQRESFRRALTAIFQEGGWCVYSDEMRYLTETLKLRSEIELLYLQGRSLGVTMVAATQRPVSIPIVAFEASHLFVWRYNDKRDIATASEFAGVATETARETIPRLPKHEVLYIHTDTEELLRTKGPAR